jgi:hypothetical protein
MEFQKWPKIPRLNRDMIITEKIDGTNAQVYITNVDPSDQMTKDFEAKGWAIIKEGRFKYAIIPGSRNKFITVKKDNYGFAKWVNENADNLLNLGAGRHYGEWWGQGIQRKYGMEEKKFSLFNVSRYREDRPACCGIVPILFEGPFDTDMVDHVVFMLGESGSHAAKGFMNPEGVVVFHVAANSTFKVTCKNDETRKALVNE